MKSGSIQFGLKTSIIALFVGDRSLHRADAGLSQFLADHRLIMNSAASKFIDIRWPNCRPTVLASQLKLVTDDLEVLKGYTVDPGCPHRRIILRFTALLAAMLRNNDQLFSLYVP